MKASKLPVSIFIFIVVVLLGSNGLFAGTVSKLSNIFTLDTRTEELPPVDGWQILTNKGDTYQEDLIIDSQGKVWCFYFRSPGAQQPVYLKIFKPDGYVYKSEQIVGHGSNSSQSQYHSIRAAENDSTGDVWVAIQGVEGGYFVIFDSTGAVKKDSTVLNKYCFSPKVVAGKNGKMWFSWHTQLHGGPDSQAQVAGYFATGERYLAPTAVGRYTDIFNTDIAVDDSNRIWIVFEMNQNGDYSTNFRIYNSDLSVYLESARVSSDPAPKNPQRQIFADPVNQMVWILQKDTLIAQQALHLYRLDGTHINTIDNIGDCGFVRNESNFLEVIRFNDQNNQNKTYESNWYNPTTAEFFSGETKFDSTYQFVRNGIAYNPAYPTLKAYAVQFDSNLTKIKFQPATPGVPEIAVKAVNFDTTKISQTYRKQRNVKVMNNGKAMLRVFNIIPQDTRFSVSDTAFQVLPGQYYNLVVQFVPTDTDTIISQLLFLSNDPDNDSLSVTVSGRGYQRTYPIITINQDSLIFDTIAIGNAQTKRIFVYNDDYYEPLKVSSIRTSNPQFYTPDSAGFIVLPKKGKWVDVNFRPNTEGLIEATMTIASNDTSRPNLAVTLRGTGVRYGTQIIAVRPDSLEFGEVALGHQRSLYFEIENKGATELEVYNITCPDSQFTTNITSFRVSPHSKYYVLATYHVKRIGRTRSYLNINSSDPSVPNYQFVVSGTGRQATPGTISISHDSLNFGSVPVGSYKLSYIWITNQGEEPLQVYAIQSDDARFSVNHGSFTVHSGYPYAVAVKFSPDTSDTVQARLTIASSDVDHDTSYVYVSGIGRNLTAPQLVLSTDQVEFGTIATTRQATKVFTIYNAGEQLLEVSKIELAAPSPSYSVYPSAVTVPYQQYRTVYLTFSPQQTGLITATVNITSNDPPMQSVALRGTGRNPLPQQIYVSHTNLNFDSVAVSKSKSQYFWIKNTGEMPLTIQNIATSDSGFSVNINNLQLNPGQVQYVLVTFSPEFPTAYQGSLVIQSDDPDNGSVSVALTGYGRNLRLQNIQLSSNRLNFEDVAVTKEKVMGLTIFNTGEQDLLISDISNNNPVFSVDVRNLAISPGSYQTIFVTFSPEALLQYTDTLRIANNDPDTMLVALPLTGTGRNLYNQKIAVFPDSANFGSVGVGLTSSQNIQIRNDGEMDLTIDSVKTNSKYFIVKRDTSRNLSPGFSQWFTVTFQPDSIGKFTALLTIYNNDPDTAAYLVPLIGYGRQIIGPQITYQPDSLIFGQVAVGRDKALQLYIGNSGEQELFGNASISGSNQFSIDQTTFSASPGGSKSLTVTFRPTVMDTVTAQLTLMCNDADSGVYVVPLRGIGSALRDPQLAYSPEQLDFKQVPLNETLTQNLLLQNLGDLPLQIFSIVSYDSHFVASQDSVTIEPEQNFYLKVTFSPDDTLEIQTILEIKSNDPSHGVVQILLKGKGKASQQQIVVSPSRLDFQEVRIFATSNRSVWISNFSEKPLNILNISSDNSHFKPQLNSFALAANDNRQVSVLFTPDSLKTFTGRLTIISDDPVADTMVVSMTGTGRDSLDQQIAVSSDSVYFDQVALNNTSTIYITVTNIGEKMLNVANIFSSQSVFAIRPINFRVASGKGQLVAISFTPLSPVTYNDTLRIVSNDVKHDTLLVKLTGVGRLPLPQQIVVSDTLLDFGTVPTDRTKSLSISVHNPGEQNLEIRNIAISDSQFSVSNNKKWLIISPGETSYLTITFAPQQSGSVNATLILESNDLVHPELVVQLRARGELYTGPRIAVRPVSLQFGNTMVGAKKKLSFWLVNLSKDSTLQVSLITLVHEAFSISPATLSIPAEDSAAVQVTFQPHVIGNHYAQATIYSNDKYQQVLQLWVYGHGIAENVGQNFLADLGWRPDGYTPVGDIFSPTPYTDSLLSSSRDRAWFIKDVSLFEEPTTAFINLCFDDEIQVFINGTLVLTDTSSQPYHWNIENRNILSFLKLGRNRISILVWNKNNELGGFDCELVVNGESKIKRGDQNWTHPDATWWYFGEMGKEYPTPPLDTPYSHLWFHSDYGLAGTDTITGDWSFEPNGSDTLYDATPLGQKAILHNITWVGGVIGQAMQFAGQANSYVELQTNLNRVPLTIELWFNCYEARQYGQNIITNKGTGQYGQGLFIDPNMRLGVYYYNGEFLTNFTVNPNTWYFISTQYQTDQILIYVNNTLVASTTYSQDNPTGTNFSFLGGNPLRQDTTTSFYGAIDELHIKNTATAPTQMQQVASIAVIQPDSVFKQQSVQLDFSIFPTPFKILSGTFEYAWGGSDNYHRRSLANPDSIFTSPLQIQVPPDSVSVRGLKYRISLQTDYGTVFYPTYNENDNDYSWIEVATQQETSAVALPARVHRMISIPYELDNASIDSVLADNLGEADPYAWRLFDWNEADTHYVAYDDSIWQQDKRFLRGRAFWLVTRQDQSFDAGSGRSPINEDFRIDLKPGWNMIATPFPYAVSWSDIQKTSALISVPIFRSTTDSIGWIYGVSTLNPWEGYFVWNGDSSERSLIVPPKEAIGRPLKKRLSLAQQYLTRLPNVSVLISADVRCGKYIDVANLFGVSRDASDEADRFDLKEAPAIGDYVSLWIDNRDWKRSAGLYTVDIRKAGADGYCWDVAVDYSLTEPKELLRIEFQRITNLPESWLMYLFDMKEDIAINLAEQNEICLNPGKGKQTQRYYKLVVGTEAFVQQNSDEIPLVPLEFELFQNYPNPFNAITNIAFNLPKRMHVSVKIYNILGQRVKTLIDEEVRGGAHKIQWDGKNDQGNLISSGLYIVRLQAKDRAAVKKLLLIK